MKCLLLTNDYPPKVGGIQVYLWELWRRLPADRISVLTHEYPGSDSFDSAQPYPITRLPGKVLLATPRRKAQINAHLDALKPDLVLIDPALPLGFLGRQLTRPYGVILHGAEATIPSQLPVLRQAMRHVLKSAEVIISASQWASQIVCDEKLAQKTQYIPPGVDTERFVPPTAKQKTEARRKLGLSPQALVLLSVSRLVPRKGMDNLIALADQVHSRHPPLELVIAGDGRDLGRLKRIARSAQVPVRFLGRVPDDNLPQLYHAADIFAMLCRSRWGGLEQEGFGVVFLEAAASGLAQLAGQSGGAAEAVEHNQTGLVTPTVGGDALAALSQLVSQAELRQQMGVAARQRAQDQFSYDLLAEKLAGVLGL